MSLNLTESTIDGSVVSQDVFVCLVFAASHVLCNYLYVIVQVTTPCAGTTTPVCGIF